MSGWAKLDNQMRQYSPFLRDNLRIDLSESNNLATTIAQEIHSLPENVKQEFQKDETIHISDRLDELIAFQSFMDILDENKSLSNPGLVRAQVITQNYISFVYLGDACFKFFRKHSSAGSITKKCCKFLTNNPVRAFRNAFAHANWKYKDDFSSLIFWARKGDDVNEAMTQFEVSQNDLAFWQALARCLAYVIYTEASEQP